MKRIILLTLLLTGCIYQPFSEENYQDMRGNMYTHHWVYPHGDLLYAGFGYTDKDTFNKKKNMKKEYNKSVINNLIAIEKYMAYLEFRTEDINKNKGFHVYSEEKYRAPEFIEIQLTPLGRTTEETIDNWCLTGKKAKYCGFER